MASFRASPLSVMSGPMGSILMSGFSESSWIMSSKPAATSFSLSLTASSASLTYFNCPRALSTESPSAPRLSSSFFREPAASSREPKASLRSFRAVARSFSAAIRSPLPCKAFNTSSIAEEMSGSTFASFPAADCRSSTTVFKSAAASEPAPEALNKLLRTFSSSRISVSSSFVRSTASSMMSSNWSKAQEMRADSSLIWSMPPLAQSVMASVSSLAMSLVSRTLPVRSSIWVWTESEMLSAWLAVRSMIS